MAPRPDEKAEAEDDRSRTGRIKEFADEKTPEKLKNATDLQVRFRTGFVYVALSVLCILVSDWTTVAFLVATAGITAGEFYYMLRSDAKLPNEMLGIIAAMLYPLSVFLLGLNGALYVSLALLLALIVWYVFWMRARVPDVGVSFFGAAYCGLLLSGLVVVRTALPQPWGGVLALGCAGRYGAAYALPGGLFGRSWAALLALAVCGILLSVSLIDAETQTIPDRLNLALAVCGAVSVLLSPADWLPHIIGALCVSVPMFLLCLVIDGAFGGGDIKLMAAAGLFLGWQNTLLAMFFGIVFGGMYGIYLLAAKKAGKKDHFAFGPFLCAGIVIAMLFGGPVLEWYCAFL